MADDQQQQKILHTGLTVEEARRLYPAKRPREGDPRPLITNSFFIEGEGLDPSECTAVVGIEPTRASGRATVRGKWMPSGKPHIVRPYWVVEIKDEPSENIDEGLAKLLDLLWPRSGAIVEFLCKRGLEAGFTTGVSIFENRPVYCLTPETLQRLAYFGLEWGLDIFDYSEPDS